MVYPNVLPAAQIQNFLTLAINKGDGAKIKQIVADAYVMLGYVLGQAIGEPDAQMIGQCCPEHLEHLKGVMTTKLNNDWQIILGGLLATLAAWYQHSVAPSAPVVPPVGH